MTHETTGAAPGGETMTPELMPCPFCGSVNVLARESSDDDNRWIVACNSKARDCPMEVTVYECWNEEGAIAAWNRRSSTPTRTATDAEPEVSEWLKRPRDEQTLPWRPFTAEEFNAIDFDGQEFDEGCDRGMLIRLTYTIRALSSSPSSTTATPLSEELGFVRLNIALAKNEIGGSYDEKALRDIARAADYLDAALLCIDRLSALPSSRALSSEERWCDVLPVNGGYMCLTHRVDFDVDNVPESCARTNWHIPRDRLTGAPK